MKSFFKSRLLRALFGKPRVKRQRAKSATRLPKPSNEPLRAMLDLLVDRYFPDQQDLKGYVVTWSSRRQRRTLGSCNISRSKINIARELSHQEFSRWIEPVLYHELCHAALGKEVSRVRGRLAWHGREFKELEGKHPQSLPLRAWIRSGGWAHAVRVDRARGR